MDDGSHAIYLSMVDECLCFDCDLSVTTVEDCMNLSSYAIPLFSFFAMFLYYVFLFEVSKAKKERMQANKQAERIYSCGIFNFLFFSSFCFLSLSGC
ncbi:hypothetical protein M752DRAFT_70984 [Aspergillus phoenicis ATCC 13157]|uniref:Uncharacterized protein n=1 Tax=Aspergillus phoenicis ATCC 13157 TaxID=1353007 RepID=A0A370PYB2_ASPPH|nr:hypothetical protein M752DRAFT_70984 [Aspergillus phoenicis ATCC 13157]